MIVFPSDEKLGLCVLLTQLSYSSCYLSISSEFRLSEVSRRVLNIKTGKKAQIYASLYPSFYVLVCRSLSFMEIILSENLLGDYMYYSI